MPSANSRVVKLKESTYRALCALIERQEARVSDCNQKAFWQGESLSFDAMVFKLIERFERDQQRKKKSAKARKASLREALTNGHYTLCGCKPVSPAERFFGIREE